jgi:hypothetical protein
MCQFISGVCVARHFMFLLIPGMYESISGMHRSHSGVCQFHSVRPRVRLDIGQNRAGASRPKAGAFRIRIDRVRGGRVRLGFESATLRHRKARADSSSPARPTVGAYLRCSVRSVWEKVFTIEPRRSLVSKYPPAERGHVRGTRLARTADEVGGIFSCDALMNP